MRRGIGRVIRTAGLRLPPSDTHTTLIAGRRRALHAPPLALRSPAHANRIGPKRHFAPKRTICIRTSRAELRLLAYLATVPGHLAGASPAWRAAPDGLGSPGRLPCSVGAFRSWCLAAAVGPSGWRVSWFRSRSSGGSRSVPGLTVPHPLVRVGSLTHAAGPAGRVRVCRSRTLPRGGR